MVASRPIVGAAAGAALSFYPLAFGPVFSGPAPYGPAAFAAAACAAAAPALACLVLEGRAFRAASRTILAACVGAVLGIAAASVPQRPAAWGLAPARVRSVVGRIASDPKTAKSGSRYAEVELLSATGADGAWATAGGAAAAFFPSSFRDGRVGRGAIVRLEGRIAEGRNGPFLKAASIETLEEPPRTERTRTSLRRSLIGRLEGVPWGPLALALLLGVKDGLDGEAEAYAAAGCAHVLALSGMHLAVVSAILAFFLKPLLGIKKAAAVGLLFVVAYVHLAGAQASLVRASLMYGFAAAATAADLPRKPLCLLSAAFLVHLCADPLAARGLSFILSYLALAGLIVAGGAADDLLRAWLPGFLRPAAAASIGAFAATAAVGAAVFGALRPVGILASLVLAPLATAFMVGALAFLVLAAIHPALGAPVDRVLRFLHAANDALVTAASRAPALQAPPAALVAALSLAAAALLVYGRKLRNDTRNRLDPIA